MSTVYVILINVLLLFIVYLVLNHKINKNSTSALLDRYAREVENLIVELNRTLDDVLNLSEERVNELKKLIKKAEKTLLSERSAPHDSGATASSAVREAVAAAGPPFRGVKGERDAKGAAAKSARRNAEDGKALREASAPPKADSLPAAGSAPGAGADSGEAAPGRLRRGDKIPANNGVPQAGVQPAAVPLYDMRGKRVDVTTPSAEEGRRGSPRAANIFERTRHLLSMGHSKDEIAKMLNLSRAEMEFLASLHNK